METRRSLKLIMEKGPREGETLKFSSGSLVKVGRVVTGNTIAIKDSGISSKHMCLQFDNQLCKWTLSDLDSSNGTVLNGQILKPYVPSALEDGDRIKVGELTSIIVKNEVESAVRPRRNPRRQGKSAAQPESDTVVENGKTELGLGFGGDLGKNEGNEPVTKRNLRSSAKKSVDSRRILTSSKQEEVNFIPTLNQIPENLNVVVTEIVDLSVPIEPKKTRGRKRKMAEQLPVDPDLDKRMPANLVIPVVGRMTRGRRKGLPVESLEYAQSSGLEENLVNASKSLQVDEGREATFDNKLSVDRLEKVNSSGLGENLDTINEPAQEHLKKLVLTQECCERKEVMADESLFKGKEVAEESECIKDGCDNGQWPDLEKMTLGDFFDYLEVQLPKEIYDKSEKIISDLVEKARKCHEFRLQRNESGKGKVVTD